MLTHTIIRGGNERLVRPLFQSDGATPLPVASLVVCYVSLYQAGKFVRTFTRGTDPELRASADGNSLVLELTSTFTRTLKAGALTEVYFLGVASADYTAEPGKDIKPVSIDQIVIA